MRCQGLVHTYCGVCSRQPEAIVPGREEVAGQFARVEGQAVRLTRHGGIQVAQSARDLGINENTLHSWQQ